MIGGRSINLALSTRGIHALQQIGIADDVLQHAIPMPGRMIHEKSGALHFAPYDVDPNKHINSIGRAALNTTLIEAAQRYPNVRVHFNHKCTGVDLEFAAVRFVSEPAAMTPQLRGGDTLVTEITERGDCVIGVDGAFSAVRHSMHR